MCDERHDEVKPVPTELENMLERHVSSAAHGEPRCVWLTLRESTPTLPSLED